MPHYVVAAIDVKDPSFMEAYGPGAHQCIAKHGGRYIARGRAATLEGDDQPQVVVILEFPDEAAARAFHADPEYKPFLDMRRAATDSRLWLASGA
ncbi:MAG: DUF1330 domain-containing protein [Sphingomonadales bacterium]